MTARKNGIGGIGLNEVDQSAKSNNPSKDINNLNAIKLPSILSIRMLGIGNDRL